MKNEAAYTIFRDDPDMAPFAHRVAVPVCGYDWRGDLEPAKFGPKTRDADGEPPQSWLAYRSSAARGDGRIYSPLAIPGLHRRFARTKLTRAAIQQFANRYGHLEADEARSLTCPDGYIWEGEPLTFWEGEIRRMRRLLALADAVERRDERLLAPFVYWRNTPWKRVCLLLVLDHDAERVLLPDAARAVRQQSTPEELARGFVLDQKHAPPGATIFWRALADEGPAVLAGTARSEPLRVWKDGDVIEPVRYFLYQQINAQLHGRVSPAILPFNEKTLQFFPDSLLSALYTLFLLELAGRTRPPILCANPHCGRHFEPTHGRQAFCDEKCRKAHHWRKNHPAPTRASEGR